MILLIFSFFCFFVLGDEAPNYACVQRWSTRFRAAIDSPLASPLSSQVNFQTEEYQFDHYLEKNNDNKHNETNQIHRQINENAKQSKSKNNRVRTQKTKNRILLYAFIDSFRRKEKYRNDRL